MIRKQSTSLMIALLPFGFAACSYPANDDLHEVSGAVRSWPGEVEAPCGDQIPLTPFLDDVGGRSGVETRALITSAQAYADYFGHAAPRGVDFGRDWVVFYAAGRKPTGGYKAAISVAGAKGDLLHVVTTLQTPGRCPVTDAFSTPYALVKLPAQKTRSVDFQHNEVIARCGDPDPQPARCTSSEQCPKGQRCSTERGDCQGCGGSPDRACPAVCFGVCEAGGTGVCSGSVIDGGCRSEEALRTEAAEQCKRQGLTLQDFGAGNACFAGGFATAKFTCCGSTPPPPPSCDAVDCKPGTQCVILKTDPPRFECVPIDPKPEVCTGGAIDGGCRSEEALKLEAATLCRQQGLALRDFGVGNACFAGGFAAAKYTCCGTQPPPPPPGACKADSDCQLTSSYCGDAPCTCSAHGAGEPQPLCAVLPVQCLVDPCADKVAVCNAGKCEAQPKATPVACEWSYMGGPTSCKPYDTWKQYASDACKAQGKVLSNLGTGGPCPGGFIEVKYECCPATR